jgi:hypothetical protein
MKKSFLLLAIILILPYISAYSFDYYTLPTELFANEWVMFTTIFLILFAVIYFPIMKKTNSTGVSIIIAAGLALLLSVPITKRGILLMFFDPALVDYIAIGAIIIGLLFIITRLARSTDAQGIKKISFIKILFIIMILAFLSPFYETILPESLLYGKLGDYINTIENLGWTVFIILAVILILWWYIKRRIRRRIIRLDERAKRTGELQAER